MRMMFNLNDRVRIRLRPSGRKMYAKHYLAFNLEPPSLQGEEDAEGWSEWQLHEVMNVFGEGCFMGADLPFETQMELICTFSKASS